MKPEIISRADAKAAGLKRYFTGEPCKHGHVAERFTSTKNCVGCLAAAKVKFRNANREKYREEARKHNAKIRAARIENQRLADEAAERFRLEVARRNAIRGVVSRLKTILRDYDDAYEAAMAAMETAA